jgi:hypothetical protein
MFLRNAKGLEPRFAVIFATTLSVSLELRLRWPARLFKDIAASSMVN